MEEHQETQEDLMYEAHAKVDALIDLLVKKGVISEDEYDEQVEKLLNELEGDEDDECDCGDDCEEDCGCDDETVEACGDKPVETCEGCA